MNLLITGAAGNLGSHLARYLIGADRVFRDNPQRTESTHISAPAGHYLLHLKLLIHRHEPPQDIAQAPNVTIYKADLAKPETLTEPCRDTDCIVHFAGVLFAPRPEKFLPETNTVYVQNLVKTAIKAGVKKFIIVSFPHVEGESTPEHPAQGILPTTQPGSAHARTRLAAEKYLFKACEGTQMTPIALRPGMIYSRGILMIDAARWASRHHLLAVWRKPTWIHLLSLPDFLAATRAAIENESAAGIYNLGDDRPLALQKFLDTAAAHWGYRKPWRAPAAAFYAAAALTEAFAAVFRTRAPLTRDFIRIGMASYVMDTSRMKAELLPQLKYPKLVDGTGLL